MKVCRQHFKENFIYKFSEALFHVLCNFIHIMSDVCFCFPYWHTFDIFLHVYVPHVVGICHCVIFRALHIHPLQHIPQLHVLYVSL